MCTLTYLWAPPGEQLSFHPVIWEVIHLKPYLEELRIYTLNNIYDVILGSASIANYIYIPEQNICFSVNDLCDADSNKIRLWDALGSEDATAIAAALRNYAS